MSIKPGSSWKLVKDDQELVLENGHNQRGYVPLKYGKEVKDMIVADCHRCIDKLLQLLP